MWVCWNSAPVKVKKRNQWCIVGWCCGFAKCSAQGRDSYSARLCCLFALELSSQEKTLLTHRQTWQETARCHTWTSPFHFNVVPDVPFLGSQWNTLNLSNYESPRNPLMSAPFEPNSITIIKMKGTEAIFHCAPCYPKHCTAYRTVCCPAPPQRLTETPQSKYYFLQMASYFHSCHICTELKRYTLAWRRHLKSPICLLLSNA